jgi:hypothetical protein
MSRRSAADCFANYGHKENKVALFVDDNFAALFEKHMHEMPYGTAKARDGDPSEWLFDYYMNRELTL